MPSFSIINQTTNDVVTSGTVATDAAVDAQKIPVGCVLVRGVVGIPRLHKIISGTRIDIPQTPEAPQIDRLDVLIEALKAKGVTLTKADLTAAAGRLKQ